MTAIHGDRDDLLWFAGLCEGEACVDLQAKKYPRLRIAMTDRDIVGRAASLMDTSIRLSLKQAPASPTFHAEVQGPRAAAIMREILPHMGARRSARIAEVLAATEFRAAPGRKSIPGPQLTRPAGIAKPATAA